MADLTDEQRARLELLGSVPIDREETWRRVVVHNGKAHATDAIISVLPGELVLVTVEVIESLLGLCGFARLATESQEADE